MLSVAESSAVFLSERPRGISFARQNSEETRAFNSSVHVRKGRCERKWGSGLNCSYLFDDWFTWSWRESLFKTNRAILYVVICCFFFRQIMSFLIMAAWWIGPTGFSWSIASMFFWWSACNMWPFIAYWISRKVARLLIFLLVNATMYLYHYGIGWISLSHILS